MDKEAEAIYKLIVAEQGHIYVCGDVTMAEHVYLTIRYVKCTESTVYSLYNVMYRVKLF